MTQKRKHYSGPEKVAILRLHLLEKQPISDLCDRYDIHPTLFYRWQKEFFENGAAAFENSGKRRKAAENGKDRKIARLEEKLQQKNEVLAELMQEYVQLKKELWGTLKGVWVPHDLRDQIVDFVRHWSQKTDIAVFWFLLWIGLATSKWHNWKGRYGKVNEHNAWIPRDHWLEESEKQAILAFQDQHPLEGYRQLTFMMLDADVVAVSPSSVYRVLKQAGVLQRHNVKPSKKGTGFVQPLLPHEHWHVDVSYINIAGTFYFLFSILDGCSRFIVHWEIRETMKEGEVETIVQRALEKFPGVTPRIISDNGPQFVAKDFKEFIRISGMSHVRTSPYYPQSNGKIERFHRTLKGDCIRTETPLSLEDAQRIVARYVEHYNTVRLHSAIGYITPKDKLEGKEKEIFAARDRKLEEARERRKAKRQAARQEGQATDSATATTTVT